MTLKENMLRVIRRENPAWVPDGMEGVLTLRSPIVERPKKEGYDSFGVHWSYLNEMEGGSFPTPGGHTIHDLARWREQITIPDVDSFDWSEVERKVKEIDREQYLVQAFNNMGLFERSYLLLGLEEALVSYLTEPDFMKELVNEIADFKIKIIERFYEAAKPDIFRYGDDWGMQTKEFLPYDVWAEVLKPATKRIYESAKAHGMLVNQHSCGKIESLVGDMVEMGADIWNPCQPSNDLAALKRRYGEKLCFCGGIDSQFVLDRTGVTGDEVRAEVRRRIDEMAAGGGYIAMPSHDIPYDQNVLFAMKDEIARYGGSFYTR